MKEGLRHEAPVSLSGLILHMLELYEQKVTLGESCGLFLFCASMSPIDRPHVSLYIPKWTFLGQLRGVLDRGSPCVKRSKRDGSYASSLSHSISRVLHGGDSFRCTKKSFRKFAEGFLYLASREN